MLKYLSLFLYFVPNLVFSEPTILQKQILNEPITMMDLFIINSEKQLKEQKYFTGEYSYKEVILEASSEKGDATPYIEFFPIETVNGDNIILPVDIEVGLDFDRGKWLIVMSATNITYKVRKNIKYTLKTAKNICKSMLATLQTASLSPRYARHRGYQRKIYTAANFENYEKFNNERALHKSGKSS